MNPAKSVITCDLEGRIETFNDGAQALFGYTPDEVVHKKRVSAFSPGLVVLGHVGGWLAEASAKGEFKTRTVFVRKGGQPFAADLKLTPTFRGEKQIGFCGVTEAVPGVSAREAMPPISFGTRLMAWMVVTRAPFLTAVLAPVLIAGSFVAATHPGAPFRTGVLALALLGAALLHVAANTFNDYFDWKSGTDQANTDYFQPFSGGSRAIELGLITLNGVLAVALVSVALASLVGAALWVLVGPQLLWFGGAGVLAAVFYTAPPLRLCARRGLGELLVGACFGPLMVAGTAMALTGLASARDYLAGIPIGLLTIAILWVNEFPDAKSDAATGKYTLVVTLGKERARWGYAQLVATTFLLIPVAVVFGGFPVGALAMLLAAPLAVSAARQVITHYQDRELALANAATVKLHLVSGLLLAAGMAAQALLS